jgi:hypothetical protein
MRVFVGYVEAWKQKSNDEEDAFFSFLSAVIGFWYFAFVTCILCIVTHSLYCNDVPQQAHCLPRRLQAHCPLHSFARAEGAGAQDPQRRPLQEHAVLEMPC